MGWEPFFQHSREANHAHSEVLREMERYFIFQRIRSPESATPKLKQLLSDRENAWDALSEIDSAILSFLKPTPRSYSTQLVMARREGEGRLWNMPPQ